MDIERIFCGGMSRSASTLQYLLVTELMKPYGWQGLGQRHKRDRKQVITKSEACRPWMAQMVRERRARAVTVRRDVRDVVVSLMKWLQRRQQYVRDGREGTFDEAMRSLPRILAQYTQWAEIACYVVQYEKAWANWEPEVLSMAQALDIPCTPERAREIADLHDLKANIGKQQWIHGWFDVETGLTREHIGPDAGKPGQWQETLSRAQVRRIEDLAGNWLLENGYLI